MLAGATTWINMLRPLIGVVAALALMGPVSYLLALRPADIKVEENPVPVNSFAVVTLEMEKGDAIIWEVTPDPVKMKEFVLGTTATLHLSGPSGAKYKVVASIVNFDTRKFTKKTEYVTVGPKKPDVKPVDPDVPPVDPDVPPVPVASFRAYLIYESGDSLTPAQRGVIFGKAVEDFLNANCTGGKTGWRRRDKNSPAEGDATMAALWKATQEKLKPTDPPCIAVERNAKVEIYGLDGAGLVVTGPDTTEKATDFLKRYREGK